MAPKKKQPHNSFFYFMSEYERNYRKSGRPYPGGFKAIAEKISPVWDCMTEEQKEPYEEMARGDLKGRQKLTTHGQTYEEVDEEKRIQEMKQDNMLSTILHTVTRLKRDTELACTNFYIVHLNYHCRTGNGVYYPAEIALSAFSIKDGMRDPYHTLVNPGPLPTGYALKARQHSEDTHRINPAEELGEPDVAALVSAVESYVEQWGSSDSEPMPPLYTLEKFVPSVQEMLARWASDCDKPEDYFRVFDLEELFYQLKLASLLPLTERKMIDGKPDKGFTSSLVAGKKLADDPYCFRPKIACQLHEDLDAVEHCSRSNVIRWGWVMCDHLCEDLRVPRVPGLHGPYVIATPVRRVTMPSSFGSKPSSSMRKSIGRGAKPKAAGHGLAVDSPRNPVWAPVPTGSRGCPGHSKTQVSHGATGGGYNLSNAADPGATGPGMAGPFMAGPEATGPEAAGPGMSGANMTCGSSARVASEKSAPEKDQFEDADFFPALLRRRHRHAH